MCDVLVRKQDVIDILLRQLDDDTTGSISDAIVSISDLPDCTPKPDFKKNVKAVIMKEDVLTIELFDGVSKNYHVGDVFRAELFGTEFVAGKIVNIETSHVTIQLPSGEMKNISRFVIAKIEKEV